MSNLILQGTYSKTGAYLIPQHPEAQHKLILHHRKKVEEKKPALYLMLNDGNRSTYLSSLFPTPRPNEYILETNKRYYSVTITETQTFIEPLKPKVS